MTQNASNLLISEVIRNIPKSGKTVDFLVDHLDISRESAYRRLRGDVSFSFEEVCELSRILDFSVDEIIRRKSFQEDISNIRSRNGTAFNSLMINLKTYFNFMEMFCQVHKTTHAMISANRIMILYFLLDYDALFKMFCYSRIYRNNAFDGGITFSQIDLPKELLDIRQNIVENKPRFNQCEYILSKDLFAGISREIQYYHRLKLVSNDDLQLLKDDLFALLDNMERQMETSKDSLTGSENLYFLSLLDIENNALCLEHDGLLASLYWNFSSWITINRSYLSHVHKEWFEAQKKYTALISQSNVFLRAEFIEKQKKHIESITENSMLF